MDTNLKKDLKDLKDLKEMLSGFILEHLSPETERRLKIEISKFLEIHKVPFDSISTDGGSVGDLLVVVNLRNGKRWQITCSSTAIEFLELDS